MGWGATLYSIHGGASHVQRIRGTLTPRNGPVLSSGTHARVLFDPPRERITQSLGRCVKGRSAFTLSCLAASAVMFLFWSDDANLVRMGLCNIFSDFDWEKK